MLKSPPILRRRSPYFTGLQTVGFCLLLLARAGFGADIAVVIDTVDSPQPIAGRLISLTSDAAVVALENGRSQHIERSHLRSLTVAPPAAANESVDSPTSSELLVLLTNGDQLHARGITREGEQLHVDLTAADTVTLPLEVIRGCLRLSGDPTENSRRLRQVLRSEFSGDTLLLRNGDRLLGELRDISAEGSRIETAGGAVSVPPEQWRAIVFDPALASVSSRPEEWTRLQFKDGSRLTAATVAYTDGQWELTLDEDVRCEVSSRSLIRIDFFGPRIQPLTALPPTRVESRPFLSQIPTFVVDRNVDFGPLALGSDAGTWGVGVWSGSRLTWKIPPGVQRFDVTVGLDAAAGQGGSADFVILLDGNEVARSGRRTGADDPLPLGPVRVAGRVELELRVEYSDRGDILDYADWLRPIWVK